MEVDRRVLHHDYPKPFFLQCLLERGCELEEQSKVTGEQTRPIKGEYEYELGPLGDFIYIYVHSNHF